MQLISPKLKSNNFLKLQSEGQLLNQVLVAQIIKKITLVLKTYISMTVTSIKTDLIIVINSETLAFDINNSILPLKHMSYIYYLNWLKKN